VIGICYSREIICSFVKTGKFCILDFKAMKIFAVRLLVFLMWVEAMKKVAILILKQWKFS